MLRSLAIMAATAVGCLVTTSCAPRVRFNQVQVIGTRNSYHLGKDLEK